MVNNCFAYDYFTFLLVISVANVDDSFRSRREVLRSVRAVRLRNTVEQHRAHADRRRHVQPVPGAFRVPQRAFESWLLLL